MRFAIWREVPEPQRGMPPGYPTEKKMHHAFAVRPEFPDSLSGLSLCGKATSYFSGSWTPAENCPDVPLQEGCVECWILASRIERELAARDRELPKGGGA